MRYKSNYLADAQVFGALSYGTTVPKDKSPFSSFVTDETLSSRQRRRFKRMNSAYAWGRLSGETEERPGAAGRCSVLISRAAGR